MRKISDPNYVYRPWLEERRKAARAKAIERSGAKPGHRLVYGTNVPIEISEIVAAEAYRFRHGGPKKRGLRATHAFMRRLTAELKAEATHR
jgi:hypothetical protein